MRQVPFGATGLTVSEIGFGAWAIGGNAYGNSYGSTDDDTSRAALRAAFEAGITFVDTADVYGHGHSEAVLGSVLKELTQKPVVATKVGGNFYGSRPSIDFSPEYLRFALDQSLGRLGLERIDLYQLHNPSAHEIRAGEAIDALAELQQAGKIGHIGVSVFQPEEALACLADPRIAAIQLVYNLLRRNMEPEVFPKALEQKVAIIAREPLSNSFLAGTRSALDPFEPGDIRAGMPPHYKSHLSAMAEQIHAVAASHPEVGVSTPAQLALRFAIGHPAVTVAIPGIKTPAQALENAAASDQGPLPEEFLAAVYGPRNLPARA